MNQIMRNAFLLLTTTCSLLTATWADVLVIAHQDAPTESLSKDDIRNVYLGNKLQWDDQTMIVPGRYRRGDLHGDFVRSVVGKSPTQFRTFWKRAIFSGSRVPFQDMRDEQAMLDFVSSTVGAMGYVSQVPDESTVKVLYTLKGDD